MQGHDSGYTVSHNKLRLSSELWSEGTTRCLPFFLSLRQRRVWRKDADGLCDGASGRPMLLDLIIAPHGRITAREWDPFTGPRGCKHRSQSHRPVLQDPDETINAARQSKIGPMNTHKEEEPSVASTVSGSTHLHWSFISGQRLFKLWLKGSMQNWLLLKKKTLPHILLSVEAF